MSFHFMIVSHLLLILHKKYSLISLCLKPEMWQKVAKFKGAEYFRKALYILPVWPCPGVLSVGATVSPDPSCLSLQYLCCNILCWEARVSLLYLEYFSCLIRCPV